MAAYCFSRLNVNFLAFYIETLLRQDRDQTISLRVIQLVTLDHLDEKKKTILFFKVEVIVQGHIIS
jgi:hypothetical protein